MSVPSPAIMSRLSQPSLRLARIFKVILQNGDVFRWAALDAEVDYRNEIYSPIGGIEGSSASRKIGLADRQQDFRGLLHVEAISDDDMRRGLLRGAKVWEYVVDFEDPTIGPVLEDAYQVSDTQWSGTEWSAQTVGVTRKLAMLRGPVASRTCMHRLGSNFGKAGLVGCKVDIESLKSADIEITSVTSRVQFIVEDTLSGSPGDDYFAFGYGIWKTGNNTGERADIASFVASTRTFTLSLPPPYALPIQVGDTIDIYPGCDHSYATCGSRFLNTLNFGGSPYIKGQDQAQEGVG